MVRTLERCGYLAWALGQAKFGTRQAKSLIRDRRYVSCQTGYLVCVSTGWSDSRHDADSPFHAIPKISRTVNIQAVVIMGIDKGVNETHYNDLFFGDFVGKLG